MTYEDVLRSYPDTPWYYRTLLRLGEIAEAQGDVEQAKVYWAEVARDCEEEKVCQQAQKGLLELREAGGE